jgi:hypothetical protein
MFAPGCITTYYRSAVSEIKNSYGPKGVPPTPSQYLPIHDRGVDILKYLDDYRLLVGTIQLESELRALLMQNYDKLYSLDTKKSDTLWIIGRDSLGSDFQTLITETPSIVIVGKKEGDSILTIINPENGKILLQRYLSPRTALTYFLNRDIIALSFAHNDSVSVEGISLSDGQIRWHHEYSSLVDTNKSWKAAAMDSVLLITGSYTAMIRASDGSEIWQIQQPFPTAKKFIFENRLLCASDSTLQSVDLSTGTLQWIKNNLHVRLIVGEGKRGALAIQADSVWYIQFFNPDNGTITGTIPIPGQIHSPLLYDGDRAYFSTEYQFFELNLNSGSIRRTWQIIPAITTSPVVADLLTLRQEKIILARESGVVAWDKTSGKQLYAVPAGGSRTSTIDFQQHKAMEFMAVKYQTSGFHPYIDKGVQQNQVTASTNYAQAYQQYQYVKTSTNASVQSGTMSRSSAANRQALAAQTAYNTAAMAAQIQYLNASMEFGKAIGSGLALIFLMPPVQRWIQTHERMQQTVASTYEAMYPYTLNDHYYIHLNLNNGWRLTLIRLSDGYRADIRLFPNIRVFNGPDGWNMPVFSISDDKQSIAVCGMLPDTTKYETKERIIYRGGYDARTFWTIPNPFLMTMKFNDITFIPSQDSIMPNPAPDDSSLALVAAAFKGDLEAVRSLLDHGTNPNARDVYGHTALMHATQMDHEEIIELLLDCGADISITDDEGLTATDYISYPPRIKNQNSIMILFEKRNAKWRDKYEKEQGK